jgi:hypothetical protein
LYDNHLQGSLTDATQFDASYDRGQPFDFQLGAGQVIKGRLKVDLHLSDAEHVSFANAGHAY